MCGICKTPVRKGGVVVKTGRYHRECLRMQAKGLLRTPAPHRRQDSTGKACGGCGATIEGPHAHRWGKPYHRECLT